jgi:predicted DNA-binding transcriptional regulator YafY
MRSDEFQTHARTFLTLVREKKYPTTEGFASFVDISHPSAKRLINRLRSRFGAPIEYDSQRQGWYLTKFDWDLELLPTSAEEIFALALARHHLKQAGSVWLGRLLETYWERLLPDLRVRYSSQLVADDLYSVSDSRRAPAPDEVVQVIFDALSEAKRVWIQYRSLFTDQASEPREISPWHLRFEDGRLYLWAFCHTRNEPRKFLVLAISDPKVSDNDVLSIPSDFSDSYLSSGFGSFHAKKLHPIRIRVHPPMARYVKEERWDPKQQDRELNGVLERAFSAGSLPEVALRLLSLGDAVEVIAPKELREEVIKQATAIITRNS